MKPFQDVSIKIKNYKCFGEKEQGFDEIKSMNLIIGRNNVGKSALLDMLKYAKGFSSEFDVGSLGFRGKKPEVILSDALQERELGAVFPNNTSGGEVPSDPWWLFGKRWLGKRITWRLQHQSAPQLVSIDPPFSEILAGRGPVFADAVLKAKDSPFLHTTFGRLAAARDVGPEPENDHLELKENGLGATNIVQSYLNNASLPTDLIRGQLLAELNKIFNPDAVFTEIDCQRLNDRRWEVYLTESDDRAIALSNQGDGLKTVLLVLILLHIIPKKEGKPLSQYIFGFEELENNIHPALQRRLLLYLRDIAIQHSCVFFLTTHSNVAIDLFSRDECCQIIHVTHDGTEAKARTVKTYIDNRGILDDLDVRASDLLQSNGIIWVEGPSDRLYFNRWIKLWTDGQLVEGAHYQCVFYGGRLLSHMTATAPDAAGADWIEILRVNRNALLLIDSDKRDVTEELNATKQRVIAEIEANSGLAWVTAGREVENYLPLEAVTELYPNMAIPSLGQFDDFFDFLDTMKPGEGTSYSRRKPLFAERITPLLAKDSIRKTLDLDEKLTRVCESIRRWNGQ